MKNVEELKIEMEALIKLRTEGEAGRLREAMEFAQLAHKNAKRKSTDQPYIVHPYEVCLIVATVTDDVDVLIGALLHDVVEDTKYTIEDIQTRFGDRVSGFVAEESEDKMENIPKDLSWVMRKEQFLNHLKIASKESKIICLGDKVSNIRSLYEMYSSVGECVWDEFNQKDPRMHAWYYGSIANELRSELGNTDAFNEYDNLCKKCFGEYA